jgi:histidine-specific SAM-dependent methyltransferase
VGWDRNCRGPIPSGFLRCQPGRSARQARIRPQLTLRASRRTTFLPDTYLNAYRTTVARQRPERRPERRDLGISVPFESGEEILTEISEKFTAKRVRNELESADLVVAATHWTRVRRFPRHPGPPVLLAGSRSTSRLHQALIPPCCGPRALSARERPASMWLTVS